MSDTYYTTWGSARSGCGHRHKSAEAATACADRDHRAIRRGSVGSAYSDRSAYEVPVDVSTLAAYSALERSRRGERLLDDEGHRSSVLGVIGIESVRTEGWY